MKSLYYFRSFDVKDRVPVDTMADVLTQLTAPEPRILLPSLEHINMINEDMFILLLR